MGKKGAEEWINQPMIRQVLISFASPKTPKQTERELGISKIKIKPFLDKGLLKALNPEARKGRFYIITCKASRMLKLNPCIKKDKEWGSIGWIVASAKQRVVILKVLDEIKMTSEQIRMKASQHNQHLTRISTKNILRELFNRDLVETEISDRRRYYWLSDDGLLLKTQLGL